MQRKAICENIHDRKLIAEAIMIKQYVDFNQLPNLKLVLNNEEVNGDVWLELVFLIRKVIKEKIALTEYT